MNVAMQSACKGEFNRIIEMCLVQVLGKECGGKKI